MFIVRLVDFTCSARCRLTRLLRNRTRHARAPWSACTLDNTCSDGGRSYGFPFASCTCGQLVISAAVLIKFYTTTVRIRASAKNLRPRHHARSSNAAIMSINRIIPHTYSLSNMMVHKLTYDRRFRTHVPTHNVIYFMITDRTSRDLRIFMPVNM